MMTRPKQRRPSAPPPPKQDEAALDAHFEETVISESLPVVKGMLAESHSMAVRLQESEFQLVLDHAMRYPRSINRVMEAMVVMATATEETASTMSFAIPRGGKIIEGQTIRFAEIIQQAWTHSETDSFVLFINRDEKYIAVRGVYFDFETAVRKKATVYRPIRDKFGKLYSDDMIAVTCNAACAIAVRNAILAGIPRYAWMPAWEAARRKAVGGQEGLPKKRQEVLKHFMRAGVAADRVLAAVGVRSEAQMTIDHITSLRGMWSAYEGGDATMDELFPPIKAMVPVEGGNGEAPKQRKTLVDLGEEDTDAEKEARAKLLEQAHDDGMTGFHKGMDSPPERSRGDAELTKAWMAGWTQAKEESVEEEEDEVALEEGG